MFCVAGGLGVGLDADAEAMDGKRKSGEQVGTGDSCSLDSLVR